MSQLKLHNYFRSSTSVRVRIALNLKNLEYDYVPYALLPNEHKSDDYLSLNPQGLVPSLETETAVLTQSLAIMEYLEDAFPSPAIMPSDTLGKARVRSLSQIIGCDIHPINNLRVLRYLESEFKASREDKGKWFRHWATTGFEALESRLKAENDTGEFCHGDAPSMADICLYAQVLNNKRFDVDATPFPNIMKIFERCDALPEFRTARPEFQPDAGS